MRLVRPAFVLGSVAALLVGVGPAWGHVVFSESQVIAGTEESILEITVPVEQEGHNQSVVVAVPDAFTARYCYAEVGWSCTGEPASASGPATFTFVRTSAAPAEEEAFSFAVDAPAEVGRYPFVVYQTYSTGVEVAWDQPDEASPRPAPAVEVVEEAHSGEEPDHDHGSGGGEEPGHDPGEEPGHDHGSGGGGEHPHP